MICYLLLHNIQQDNRAEEEYNVSHIPSAVRIDCNWRNFAVDEIKQAVKNGGIEQMWCYYIRQAWNAFIKLE